MYEIPKEISCSDKQSNPGLSHMVPLFMQQQSVKEQCSYSDALKYLCPAVLTSLFHMEF